MNILVNNFLIVFVGGGIGAILRYFINNISGNMFLSNSNYGFPWGTFVANILGSFLIGLVVGLFDSSILNSEQLKLFIIVGILGGFTTFSSFSLETVNMLQAGYYMKSVIHISSSTILAIAFTILGMKLGHSF
jgi:CrcB protein